MRFERKCPQECEIGGEIGFAEMAVTRRVDTCVVEGGGGRDGCPSTPDGSERKARDPLLHSKVKVESMVVESDVKTEIERSAVKVEVVELSEEEEDEDESSRYEAERKRIMEENKRRMMELGLCDLGKQLSPVYRTKVHMRTAKNANARINKEKHQLDAGFTPPPRRSSRYENRDAASYKELYKAPSDVHAVVTPTKRFLKRTPAPFVTEEYYTEKQANSLGSWTKEWVLCRDGYEAGVRIYDPLNGKTCHQCRQKTLGQRTWCSQCNSLVGQFCGDCIYMRYGENLLEVQKNPNWVCPVCRDICNCSICRRAKGWEATGNMYRFALAQGYRSVAHYLVLTKLRKGVQSESDDEENVKPCRRLSGSHARADQAQNSDGYGASRVGLEDKSLSHSVEIGLSDVEESISGVVATPPSSQRRMRGQVAGHRIESPFARSPATSGASKVSSLVAKRQIAKDFAEPICKSPMTGQKRVEPICKSPKTETVQERAEPIGKMPKEEVVEEIDEPFSKRPKQEILPVTNTPCYKTPKQEPAAETDELIRREVGKRIAKTPKLETVELTNEPISRRLRRKEPVCYKKCL